MTKKIDNTYDFGKDEEINFNFLFNILKRNKKLIGFFALLFFSPVALDFYMYNQLQENLHNKGFQGLF